MLPEKVDCPPKKLDYCPKKVDFIPEKVVSLPKTVDSLPENVSFLYLLASGVPDNARLRRNRARDKSYSSILHISSLNCNSPHERPLNWTLCPYTLHPTPEKSHQKAIFLAQFKIIHYLCTRNQPTPWDYVFRVGWLQT